MVWLCHVQEKLFANVLPSPPQRFNVQLFQTNLYFQVINRKSCKLVKIHWDAIRIVNCNFTSLISGSVLYVSLQFAFVAFCKIGFCHPLLTSTWMERWMPTAGHLACTWPASFQYRLLDTITNLCDLWVDYCDWKLLMSVLADWASLITNRTPEASRV